MGTIFSTSRSLSLRDHGIHNSLSFSTWLESSEVSREEGARLVFVSAIGFVEKKPPSPGIWSKQESTPFHTKGNTNGDADFYSRQPGCGEWWGGWYNGFEGWWYEALCQSHSGNIIWVRTCKILNQKSHAETLDIEKRLITLPKSLNGAKGMETVGG